MKKTIMILMVSSIIASSCCRTKPPVPNCPCNTTVPVAATDDTKALEKQNHYTDTVTANNMIAKFLKSRERMKGGSAPDQSIVIPVAESFNREAIQNLLLQDNCVGIKISFGLDEKSQLVTIISGIAANGTSMKTPLNPCNSTPKYMAYSLIENSIHTH